MPKEFSTSKPHPQEEVSGTYNQEGGDSRLASKTEGQDET